MSNLPPKTPLHAPKGRDRPTVVVVEDDADLLGALQYALEAEGYDVRTFANQMEVLAAQDIVSSAACLVVDYRMQPLNGLEMFDLLRSRGMKAPAVLITTNPDSQCIESAARLGVDLVEKPLVTDALSLKIAELIAARKLH
jgi:two-component system response regulator FixJ